MHRLAYYGVTHSAFLAMHRKFLARIRRETRKF